MVFVLESRRLGETLNPYDLVQRLDGRAYVDADPEYWNQGPLYEVGELERCAPNVD